MKKALFVLLLALLLLLPLASCNGGAGKEKETGADGDTSAKETEGEPTVTPDKKILLLAEPGTTEPYREGLKTALGTLGEVSVVPWNGVNDKHFSVDETDLIVITDGSRIADDILTGIEAYRKKGGKVIVLGGPVASEIPSLRADGSYLTTEEFLAESEEITLQFNASDKKNLNKVGRNASNPVKRTLSVGDFGLGHNSLKLENDFFTGWDLMTFPISAKEEDTVLCFNFRGSGASNLYIELYMEDGTRWLGPSLPVTDDWTFTVLKQSDFGLYSGTNTDFRFSEIKNLWIGGTGLTEGQGYELCLDSISTGTFELPKAVSAEGLTEKNDFYRITNGASLTAYAGQAIVAARDYHLPDGVWSTLKRMESTGCGLGRGDRFIPLLEVSDAKGLHCGYGAWLSLRSNTGALALFPLASAFYDENGLNAVKDAAEYLLAGNFLLEGGTGSFVFEPDTEKIEVKASYLTAENVTLRLSFLSGDKVLKTTDTNLSAAQKKAAKSDTLVLSGEKPDRVVAELVKDGKTVDKISQEILVYTPSSESERNYVTLKDGGFSQSGKAVHPVGVNYFGCYGGVVSSNAFTANAVFDPYLVRRDLERIKEIGFNAIAVQISPYADGEEVLNGKNRNMIMVLSIARELGLYVDVYLPFEDDISKCGKIISALHLSDFDNLIAYDIFWEGAQGRYADLSASAKSALGKEWNAFLTEQFGSAAKASGLIGMTCPSVPDYDALFVKENATEAEARLAAVLRRFLDDHYGARFGSSCERIRTVDPNHLISFRCCDAGLPTAVSKTPSYYDFSSFCGALDFVSPEGYGFTSYQYDASSYEGAFAEAYARLVSGPVPTVWKEFGWSVWGGSNDVPKQSNLDYCGKVYRKVYDAVLLGQGGGTYAWWYTGGLRPGEGSDYGVVGPDGSDRPASLVVREYAAKMKALVPAGAKEADVIFTVDRDLYANGLKGIYDSIEAEFKAALDAGKTVSLVSAGKKMTVAEAIAFDLTGGTTGEGPRKYLNCLFRLAIDGKGTLLTSGGKAKDGALTVFLANNGYTDWAEGDVVLLDENGTVLASLPALKQGETAKVTLTLSAGTHTIRASAEGKEFGGSFSVVTE